MLNKIQCEKIFSEMDIDTQRAMIAIAMEKNDAIKKHSSWPMNPKKFDTIERLKKDNDFVHGAAIVAEESGELVRAALRFHYEDRRFFDMHKEAIQCGAMALRFITQSPSMTF